MWDYRTSTLPPVGTGPSHVCQTPSIWRLISLLAQTFLNLMVIVSLDPLLFSDGRPARRNRNGPQGLPLDDGVSNVETLQQGCFAWRHRLTHWPEVKTCRSIRYWPESNT